MDIVGFFDAYHRDGRMFDVPKRVNYLCHAQDLASAMTELQDHATIYGPHVDNFRVREANSHERTMFDILRRR